MRVVKQRRGGREYERWRVNYPGGRAEGGKRNRRRRQNMFANEERAKAFMEACLEEMRRNRQLLLVGDSEAYWDAIRAKEVLVGVPGASLEVAAWLLRACQSSREKRGGGYEVERERKVELEPRVWLGLENACKWMGCGVKELVGELAWKFLEEEAERMRKEEEKRAKGDRVAPAYRGRGRLASDPRPVSVFQVRSGQQ
jgi:hypothetical protein